MPSVNKSIILGYLGKDPETSYTPGGVAVCKFSVATSEKYTDKKTGQKQESTEWHNIVFWNKLAEVCQKYLKKGSMVYLEGRIQTRSWDDRDGNKRYMTEIIGNQLQIISSQHRSAGQQSANDPGGYNESQGFI